MILIIDDKPESVQGIIDVLDENKTKNTIYNYKYFQDFDEGTSFFSANYQEIDILILDLKKDPLDEYPGKDILDGLWDKKFLPTVVFSVSPEEVGYNHNFIATFNKTEEIKVIKWLENIIENYIEKINAVKKSINEIYRDGLRGLNSAFSSEENSISVVNYMSFVLDQKMHSASRSNRLNAQIQYVILNKYTDLQATDIIQTIPTDSQSPEFYMIITASCDLANEHYRQVVCKKIIEFNKQSRKKESGRLNDGGYKGKIYLPPNKFFKNCIVDCKDTIVISDKKVISINPKEIDTVNYTYRKITSIASPFKERIINLIYNHESRIGVPDLEENSWWEDEV